MRSCEHCALIAEKIFGVDFHRETIDEIEAYSTEIKSAWKVIEKLFELGVGCRNSEL